MTKNMVRTYTYLALILAMVVSHSAMAETANELVIGHTWDGNELAAVDKAVVNLSWLDNGDLSISVDSPFANDPKPDCDSTSCWELWNHEVVELFLVNSADPAAYTEIEISPWGNHLVLQLLGSRNVVAKQLPLELTVTRSGDRWSAEAVLSQALIPAGALTVNAYRISGTEPNRNYHVMTPMVSDEPDFHLIDQFDRVVTRVN